MAYTVLIVDGEPMVRRSLALLLETHGFQVAMAPNAPQAITAFPNVDPDAFIAKPFEAEDPLHVLHDHLLPERHIPAFVVA